MKRGTGPQDSVPSIVFEKKPGRGSRREGPPSAARCPSPRQEGGVTERGEMPVPAIVPAIAGMVSAASASVSARQIARFPCVWFVVHPSDLTDVAPLRTECLIQGPVGPGPSPAVPQARLQVPSGPE